MLPSVVRPIDWKHARRIIEHHHYLGHTTAGCKFCLGVYNQERQLMGVMIFGRPVARLEDQNYTLELSRMFLFNGAPKNSCSRALSLAETWIRENYPEISRLISYADPFEGHTGSIYKAANWEALGQVHCNPWSFREGRRGRIGSKIKLKFERIIRKTPVSNPKKKEVPGLW